MWRFGISVLFKQQSTMFKKLLNKKSKEESFWDWFLENEPTLYYGTEDKSLRDEIFAELSKRIKAIDDNLTFAFGPIRPNDTKEFIVSADGIVDSFPFVVKLVEAAPSHANWEYLAFRQPNEGDDIAIKMEDFEMGYKDVFFRYLEEDGILDLQLNIRGYDASSKHQFVAYLLLDSLIGEYDTQIEIDSIDWVELDENNIDKLYPFVELRKIIERRKSDRST